MDIVGLVEIGEALAVLVAFVSDTVRVFDPNTVSTIGMENVAWGSVTGLFLRFSALMEPLWTVIGQPLWTAGMFFPRVYWKCSEEILGSVWELARSGGNTGRVGVSGCWNGISNSGVLAMSREISAPVYRAGAQSVLFMGKIPGVSQCGQLCSIYVGFGYGVIMGMWHVSLGVLTGGADIMCALGLDKGLLFYRYFLGPDIVSLTGGKLVHGCCHCFLSAMAPYDALRWANTILVPLQGPVPEGVMREFFEILNELAFYAHHVLEISEIPGQLGPNAQLVARIMGTEVRVSPAIQTAIESIAPVQGYGGLAQDRGG